jgi:hypothetical protein
MTLNESFIERLKRTIYCLAIKEKDFWISIAFTSKQEAIKYREMYPNREITMHACYLYENAEDAISPQKLSLVTK